MYRRHISVEDTISLNDNSPATSPSAPERPVTSPRHRPTEVIHCVVDSLLKMGNLIYREVPSVFLPAN
jgi:hypothetical protein